MVVEGGLSVYSRGPGRQPGKMSNKKKIPCVCVRVTAVCASVALVPLKKKYKCCFPHVMYKPISNCTFYSLHKPFKS